MKISNAQLHAITLIYYGRSTHDIRSQTMRSLFRAGLVSSVLERDVWVHRLTDKALACVYFDGDGDVHLRHQGEG